MKVEKLDRKIAVEFSGTAPEAKLIADIVARAAALVDPKATVTTDGFNAGAPALAWGRARGRVTAERSHPRLAIASNGNGAATG